MKKIVLSLVFLATGLLVSGSIAQDAVVFQVDTSKPVQTRTGKILDYNSQVLTLKVGDNERRIPSSQIQRIATPYTASQLSGDEQRAAKNYPGAIRFYREALDREPRPWVQRIIAASLIQTLQENGNWTDAANRFSEMMGSESKCRFFHVIPLSWSAINPNVNREHASEAWVKGEDELQALLGCSYLMSTNKRDKAITRLQKFKQSKNANIARLATMQLWRSRMLVASETEVKSWQSKLKKFPETIRCGGYFVIAGALANNPKLSKIPREQAALASMKIPILFPAQHRLSATALHRAAKLLKTSDPMGAKKILQELLAKFPNTEFGKAAAIQLKK